MWLLVSLKDFLRDCLVFLQPMVSRDAQVQKGKKRRKKRSQRTLKLIASMYVTWNVFCSGLNFNIPKLVYDVRKWLSARAYAVTFISLVLSLTFVATKNEWCKLLWTKLDEKNGKTREISSCSPSSYFVFSSKIQLIPRGYLQKPSPNLEEHERKLKDLLSAVPSVRFLKKQIGKKDSLVGANCSFYLPNLLQLLLTVAPTGVKD